MLIGHYGPALAIRSSPRSQPLWVYAVLVQAPDIVFFALAPFGIEELVIRGEERGPLALDLVSIPGSHSLVSTLLVAGLIGVVFGRWFDWYRGGLAALAYVSHWALDLLVHDGDLPLLPGEGEDVGLGWWRPWQLGLTLELTVLAIGCVLLLRARPDPRLRRRYLAFVAVLAVAQVVYVLVPPLEPVWVMSLGAESLYVAVAGAAWWVEREPAARQRPMNDRALTSSGESSGSGIAS